jgi:hypothetical protein
LGAIAVEWLHPDRLGYQGAGLFAPFAQLLAASRDPRAIEVLSAVRDDAKAGKRHQLAALATAALANLPAPAKGKISATELARLQAAFDGAQARSKPLEPFAEIYADPDSDAARLAAAAALELMESGETFRSREGDSRGRRSFLPSLPQ